MAKTIYTFIPNDDLSGSRIVTMDDCSCKMFKIIRSDSEILKTFRENLETPALYILLNKEEKKAYIGESDTLLSRLATHILKKHFWKEALVFTAIDESISKTECKYLEYLAYDKVKMLNRYDVSENIIDPTIPHMNFMQKAKTEGFFNNVLFLTRFIGCDIFDNVASSNKRPLKTRKNEEIDLDITSKDLEGTGVKISLNGTEYIKGHMGFAIVKEYLINNPQTTMEELNDYFHIGLLGSWGRWNILETNIENAKSLKKSSGQYRHLVKDEFILTSGDGIRFVVSNQWDKINILNLLQIAKNQGWSFEVIKNVK